MARTGNPGCVAGCGLESANTATAPERPAAAWAQAICRQLQVESAAYARVARHENLCHGGPGPRLVARPPGRRVRVLCQKSCPFFRPHAGGTTDKTGLPPGRKPMRPARQPKKAKHCFDYVQRAGYPLENYHARCSPLGAGEPHAR